MKYKKLPKILGILVLITSVSILGYTYIRDYNLKEQEDAKWEQVQGHTYDSNSTEEIYITSKEPDVSKIQNEKLNTLLDNYVLLNSKTNYYRTRPKVGPLFGLFSEYHEKYEYVYLIKKDHQKISVAKLEKQYIYDQRDEYNGQFTVTIKKLDEHYRVYLKNKKVEYNSTNLP